MTILIAVLFFGVMIFLHELGHFIAARIFHVTVHEFALGMGPKLISWGKKETRYSLRLIPMGGFVRLEGEDESSQDPGSLTKKPAWQRLIILVSGAFMNILLGFLIFIFLNISTGTSTSEVTYVVPDSPAAMSGIEVGDTIVKLDHTGIHTMDDMHYFFYRNGRETVDVTVRRGGEKQTFSVNPQQEAEDGYIIGIHGNYIEHPGFLLTIRSSWYDTVFVGKVVYLSLWDLLTGKVGMREMSGPVGIVGVIGEAAQQSTLWLSFLNVLYLMAMISINLGIFNLLPFPALDGGRAVFAIVEMIRRKPVKPEHEGWVHAVGFALLIALMLFVTWSDIQKLIP